MLRLLHQIILSSYSINTTRLTIGTLLSSSVHLWDIVTRSPVSLFTVRIVPSRALKLAVVFFWVTSMDLATTMDNPSVLVNLNLMLPFTLVWPIDLGSWTKLCPDLFPGGKEPVTAYLRDSIIVVLPATILNVFYTFMNTHDMCEITKRK